MREGGDDLGGLVLYYYQCIGWGLRLCFCKGLAMAKSLSPNAPYDSSYTNSHGLTCVFPANISCGGICSGVS